MRKHLPLLIFFFLIVFNPSNVFGQEKPAHKLFLRSGTITPPENISTGSTSLRKSADQGKTFVIIQFYDIPTQSHRDLLKNAGIELLEYIPDYAYTATVAGAADENVLKEANARSIIDLAPEQKIEKSLLEKNRAAGTDLLGVRLNYPASFSYEEIEKALKSREIEIISSSLKSYQILEIRIPAKRLSELASLPFAQYMEEIPEKPVPLNDKSMANTKANLLSSEVYGFNLTGEGVVVGVGDYGDPSQHIDLASRVIENASYNPDVHGIHVTGTIAGAGIINEKYRGYAPKSMIVNDLSDDIWRSAPSYVKTYGMVITNNSYGGSAGCPTYGTYTSSAYVLDRQAYELPSLQHVFAAGNDGSVNCPDYPAGLGNISSPYASAKNVISVGQVQVNGIVSPQSSKGPVKDGRVKPELTAPGTLIYSTISGNKYAAGTGTSMSAPAVSGGLALLYQRYRQLNGQKNPKNALMKALICNGAFDHGLAGPDYSYGFGGMNLLRSLKMLNAAHYINGQVAHQEKKQHQVNVPVNTAKLKVMLYWNDPAQSLLTGEKTLINNLDLRLIRPNQTAVLPLAPLMTNAAAAALEGLDDINNVEQIIIDNPAAGNYTLEVTGKLIPADVQEYFIVYDPIEVSTVMTYPAGKERLAPGDVVNVAWESYGNAESKFSLQYSLNGGGSWTAIDNNVASDSRQISWTVPSTATTSARVRVIQNQTNIIHESGNFTILGTPVVSLAPAQCESYIALKWTAVTAATDYEIMRIKGEEITSVAVVSGLSYTFSALSKDSTYFLTVRARKDGIPGRRGVALSRKPDGGTCTGSISDNDILLESIISPVGSGRLHTSSELTPAQPVTLRIKNLDDQPTSGLVEAGFAVGDNSAPIYWESVGSSIPAGGSLNYTFTKKVDLQALGSYHFRFYVRKVGDQVEKNNFLEMTVKQIDNQPVKLPYFEQFEGMPDQEIIAKMTGLDGAERYDFSSSQPEGRLRTAFSPGNAYSGNRAITLDVKKQTVDINDNSLTGTYNLSGYKVHSNEIFLSFMYRAHNETWYNFNSVSIRGDETKYWAGVYSYYQNQITASQGYQMVTVNLSELLKSNSQDFSETFQIQWNQSGYYPAFQDATGSGYTYDDIRIFEVESDVEVVEILSPPIKSCWEDEIPKLSVKVRNNGLQDCYDVPLKAQSQEGYGYNGAIPFIKANSEIIFDIPNVRYVGVANADYKVRVWTEKSYDKHPENDSREIIIKKSPQIIFFPYLENFENGAGYWSAGGTNNSWEFGHPESEKIKTAASGSNAWKTNLKGNHQNDELSYLYSPCFFVAGMEQPTLSFSAAVDLENCPDGLCDEVYVEYITDGNDWIRLGEKDNGTNWYNTEKEGLGSWSATDHTRWHVSTINLPHPYYANIRFRFVLKSNGSGSREGIAIDDIHVYDKGYEIDEADKNPAITQAQVFDHQFVHFINDNNRITASVHSENQPIANVSVQSFLNTQPVRISDNKYYLDRNFKITKTSGNLLEPVAVRLYVSDTEIKRLISAPDKTGVQKPQSAYDLAITQYSGTNEDGNLLNNAANTWTFIPAAQVAKVPYGKGYYFEFKAKNFSEFWFAKDYIGQGSSLPVELITFSAKRAGATDLSNDVLLKWTTASEKDFSHFEIELAEDEEQVRKQLFSKIGEVKGFGLSAAQQVYTFTDHIKNPAGTRYYRLKMMDTNQTFTYSAIRSVSFDQNIAWKLYPNPSRDFFEIEFQAEKAQQVDIHLYETGGRLIKSETLSATGSVQVKNIDLSKENLPAGIYMLEVVAGEQKQTFKILKE